MRVTGEKGLVLILAAALLSVPASPRSGHAAGELALTRYGVIDIRADYQAVRILQGNDSVSRSSLIQEIKSHPGRYTPAVLYVLAQQVFATGNRGEAMYWYYSAQLRTRYDVNRCLDNTAGAVLRALNQAYGGPIEQYARQNIPTFRQIVAEAVRFENNTAHRYDPRWINLHGMRVARAVTAAQQGMSLNEPVAMTRPEEQWEAIHRQTIEDFKKDVAEKLSAWTNEG